MIKKVEFDKYLFLSLIIGIVATLWHYKFGVGDQLDHLIFVYKTLDKEFLVNDAYASLVTSFSVRTYFAYFIAFFSKIFGVSLVYFVLSLVSNLMLAIFTYLTALFLTNEKLSGIISCILVMTITTINMGDITTLYSTGLAPDRLALPFVIAAFYFALKNKPLAVALLCGFASLFHVLLGAVIGAVLLFAIFILEISKTKKVSIRPFIIPAILFLLFISATLIPFFLANTQHIPTNEFVDIYAFFRVPHHLVPSFIFASNILIRSILFFLGAFVAGYLLYSKFNVSKQSLIIFLLVASILIALCFIGYLFVEVFPSRLGVSLQAFRYLTVLKWMAFVLIGSYVGLLLAKKDTLINGVYTFASTLSPVLLFATFVYELFCFLNKNERLKLFTKPIFGLFMVVAYLLYKATNPETVVLFIWLGLALILVYLNRKWFYLLLSAFLLIVGLNSTILRDVEFQNPKINTWFSSNYRPVFTYDGYTNNVFDVCRFIEKNTPVNAVFLTPPEMAELGTVAKRASVVSFKMAPFTDMAIRDWKNRLDFCYGTSHELGFDAERALSENYCSICDEHILEIKKTYGITYAVLFQETNSDFPVFYSNATYKLVKLND